MSYPQWAAVVALKPAAVGKSRLAALPAPLRRRLATLMAMDSLAALACVTARLVVISDSTTIGQRLQRAGITADVIKDPEPGGLNNALRAGEALLRAEANPAVLACVGDLPALTSDAVRAVIDTMTRATTRQHNRGFVADLDGTGSTMLLADHVDLDPRFGPGSAAAHRSSGAVDLAALTASSRVPDRCVGDDSPDARDDFPRTRTDFPRTRTDFAGTRTDFAGARTDFARARTDVDTPDDLPRAIAIGVGRYTATLIADGRLADYEPLTITGLPTDRRRGYDAISHSGREFVIGFDAVDADVRPPYTGQQLHAAVHGDRVISAWLN